MSDQKIKQKKIQRMYKLKLNYLLNYISVWLNSANVPSQK